MNVLADSIVLDISDFDVILGFSCTMLRSLEQGGNL